MKTRTLHLFLALALSIAPAVLADGVVESGADYWRSSTDTFTSFADQPIPAGFFCDGSPMFDGRVRLEGRPLVTQPAGVLGEIDTIVHRLDDASFDADGNARTRIQLLALSLGSVAPVDVGCETPYDVTVSLDGEQPITWMTIVREEEQGGSYVAPLDLKVRVLFTPVGEGEERSIVHRIALGPGSHSVWSFGKSLGSERTRPVTVDTDGDRIADTTLPLASNFLAGVAPGAVPALSSTSSPTPTRTTCPYQSCHCNPDSNDPYEDGDGCDDDHLHCVWTYVPCEAEPVPKEPTATTL